jgi:two-component system sensor histidine kinase KdpD
VGQLRNQLRRYAAAAAIVAASTGAAEIVYRLTESTRLSMIFLAGVLVTAYLLGSGPAYFAASLAFLIYDFYLVEPRFTLTFSTSDMITLVVFLAVAMLTGRLTGRVKDQAKRAQARARTTSALFDATRAFSGSSDEAFIRDQLARHLSAAAKGDAFVRHGPDVVTCPAGLAVPAEVARVAMQIGDEDRAVPADTVVCGEWRLRALTADVAVLGVVGWRVRGDTERDQKLVEILADVGAAAIARARLAAGKAEAEARARTEDLRNALLSSISHDLRTPLAAIMASASSLSEFGESFDAPTRKDLSATIQQEAERLDSFVANLLNMTRLESGALTVQRVAFSVSETIERVVSRGRPSAARPVTVSIASNLPEALGDPVLFEQAFWNVYENALRYTPELGAVDVVARGAGDEIEVRVEDNGPGLPAADLTRVFDKFFRSSVTAQKPGTGLGLSITRGLVEGMGGAVAARPREDGKSGLVITLRVPAAR